MKFNENTIVNKSRYSLTGLFENNALNEMQFDTVEDAQKRKKELVAKLAPAARKYKELKVQRQEYLDIVHGRGVITDKKGTDQANKNAADRLFPSEKGWFFTTKYSR